MSKFGSRFIALKEYLILIKIAIDQNSSILTVSDSLLLTPLFLSGSYNGTTLYLNPLYGLLLFWFFLFNFEGLGIGRVGWKLSTRTVSNWAGVEVLGNQIEPKCEPETRDL